MIRMLRDWGAAILVGIAVFLVVDYLMKGPDPTGKPAPAFTLTDAHGGQASLADYAGKTLILNFWGTWCPPCRAEIPEFAAWAKDHPETPILGIAARSGSGEKLAKDAERLGVTWSVLEADDAVLEAYGVDVFPTTIVIGPDGTMKSSARGAIDGQGLDRLLDQAK